jgi:hypothetical protein
LNKTLGLPDGWLSDLEARLLLKSAAETSGKIIEVGTFKGRSAVALASLERTVVCIDPWSDGFAKGVRGDDILSEFMKNIEGVDNIIPVRSRVEDALPIPAGFVYLDGDHSYDGTIKQIQFAILCSPSCIAIHDVNDKGGGLKVKRAAISILGPWDYRTERLAVWWRYDS